MHVADLLRIRKTGERIQKIRTLIQRADIQFQVEGPEIADTVSGVTEV